jgi:hypothetical protein
MNRHDDQVNWYQIVNEYVDRERLAEPVHPTWHVGPNLYKAALEIGYRPEDLTLVTPGGQYEDSLAAYIDRELPRRYHQLMEPYWHELIEGDRTGEPLGVLSELAKQPPAAYTVEDYWPDTTTGQDTEMTRDGAGGSYVQISGENGKVRYEGPAPWEPQQQNDMRPRVVDRAKVKAARKIARVNRRKRGKH